jgi:hypothetical protein
VAQPNEIRRESVHQRLAASREEFFALAHVMKGDAREPELAAVSDELPGSFPQSHIMRALLGRPGRLLLGGAALALTLTRPKLLWRAARFTPLLRPLLLRYVLPRLLGQ